MGLGGIGGIALGTAAGVAGIGLVAGATGVIMHEAEEIVPRAKQTLKERG